MLLTKIFTTVALLSDAAVRNKPKAVHEDPVSTDSPQHQPQNLTKKSPDINSLELEQCPAYANASLNY